MEEKQVKSKLARESARLRVVRQNQLRVTLVESQAQAKRVMAAAPRKVVTIDQFSGSKPGTFKRFVAKQERELLAVERERQARTERVAAARRRGKTLCATCLSRRRVTAWHCAKCAEVWRAANRGMEAA